ncbi:uncharacterized protein [Mytilus edulis]|uniref:uncharacterized protein n=1 Tax=Mytilus edulis TaxID=6550 RepID=UPI0039EE6647
MQSAIINTYETFREEDLDVCLNPQHERAKLKHFCNSPNCQSLLCPSCVVAEHRDPSNHELEDIEETFKKKKIKLGKYIKSLRRRISQVESTMLNVQDSTLQDEKTAFLRNVDAIFNRGIKILENKRQKLVDRYNVACKQKESKDRLRKDSLDNFLKNATEYCNRSEQLINRNSMRSLLNVHQSVEAHLNMYLDMPVADLTRGENDFEEKIEFDLSDLFDIKVENMEYASEKEDNELLIKLTKENKQQNYLRNTISRFKKYNFKKVKTVFSYSMQSVLHVIALILVIIKLPLNLIQLLNNDKKNQNDTQVDVEQHNERHDGNIHLDVRQVDRGNLGHNELVDAQTHSELEKIQGYVIRFRDISWHIMMLLIIAMVIREITLIPFRMLGHGKSNEFEFDTRDTNQFACRSADNHTLATKPSEDMSCGSTGRLFKYGGVFANTTFPLEESSSIEFSIRFQPMALRSQNNVQDNAEYTVFEFGLTNDSISKEFLYPSVFSVSAFNCPNSFGVCLKTDNGILLPGKAIFKSETNSLFYEGRFILAYQPSDFTVLIQAKFPKKNTTKELHSISFTKLISPFRPVFAAYNSDKITVSMTIVTNHVGFDRKTLHPNLYISDDNKTISNTKLNATHPGNNLKMYLSNEFLNTMISIDFDESNSGDTLLKIGMRERNFELSRDRNKKVSLGLREKEEVIFKTTEILKLTKCNVTFFFGFYRTISYCLSDNSNANRIVVGDHIDLFLYYNMYGLDKLYILDNFSGYRYFNFHFNSNYMPWFVMGLPAGLGPDIYIEKVRAQDIVVASSEIKNELNFENNPKLFLALLLGIVLIISKIIIDFTQIEF